MKPDTSFVLKSGHFHLLPTLPIFHIDFLQQIGPPAFGSRILPRLEPESSARTDPRRGGSFKSLCLLSRASVHIPQPSRDFNRPGGYFPAQKANVEIRGIPHLAKSERDAPNFLHTALDMTACAPFFKERRLKCAEPNKLHRKSGMWDTRPLWNMWVRRLF